MPPKHLFYPRINAFRDETGAEIGSASSLWVLLDVNTRRIVNNEVVLAHLPDNGDMPAGAAPGVVRPLEGAAETRKLLPPYSDFDVNGHVNNTKYLDWACSALGHERMAANRLLEFTIIYDSEIRPGVEIHTELIRQDGRFTFCGSAGEKRCFSIGGVLGER